jgi:hypothetical protein
MLQEKHMPKHFWAEVVSTAVYLLNRTYSTEGAHITPHEAYFGHKPTMAHLRVFGSIAYVHIPDEKRKKLDSKSEKCILIGYSQEQKSYKCFNPMTREVRVSRDVVFDESASWYSPTTPKTPTSSEPDSEDDVSTAESTEIDLRFPEECPTSLQLSGPEERLSHYDMTQSGEKSGVTSPRRKAHRNKGKKKASQCVNEASALEQSDFEHSDLGPPELQSIAAKRAMKSANEKLRCSSRHKNPVMRYRYNEYMAHHYAFMIKVTSVREPESFVEALRDAQWRAAMEEEIQALDANRTWDLVVPPKGFKPIGCKWIYKVKYNTEGSFDRYKARLVAKGYAQTHGIDYDEIFAPVAKMTTVCKVLAVAAAKGWHLHQMDVKNAFLQGDLEEEVYMVQPPGFRSTVHPTAVCRLKKSLYGLKQAPRNWHSKTIQFFHKISLKSSHADTSLYVRQGHANALCVLLYVYDLVITGADLTDIN